MIEINQFGKDHWSLLLYVESRVQNYKGVLDKNHLRIKNPVLNSIPDERYSNIFGLEWKPEYGTRLKGYFLADDKHDLTKRLDNHDDLDCLDDLEEAGLIKSFGTGLNPAYNLTKKGIKICGQLTLHKQNGGWCSNFEVENDK